MAETLKPGDEECSGLKTLGVLAKVTFVLALMFASVIWAVSLLDLMSSRSPTCRGYSIGISSGEHNFLSLFIIPAVCVAMVGFWGWRGTQFLTTLRDRLRMPKYARTPNYSSRFTIIAYVTLAAVLWELGTLALSCISR